MDSLFAPLPRAVEVDGVRYPLHTDFRVALRILAAFEDEGLAAYEQQGIMLSLLYEGRPPPDLTAAARLGILFLNCGKTPAAAEEAASMQTGRLFSFSHDAPLIWAAMQRSHGVDVLDGPMHWYRFAALFADIAEDTFFSRIVALRRAQRLGTLTREQRRCAAQLEGYLRLPEAGAQGQTEETRAFFAALEQGE